MIIIIVSKNNIRFNYLMNKYIILNNNKIIFYQLYCHLKSNNSDFKYNKSISLRSMAPPCSKHGQDPKAKKEMESLLKYNLEDKSENKEVSRGFEANNYQKIDNFMKNYVFL